MILVADSGSSKTDWLLQRSDDNNPLSFRTLGINPFYLNEDEIKRILVDIKPLLPYLNTIKEVHFFGAGCSNPDRRETVSNALSAVFEDAFINVEHDLLGSVYATCGDQPGITCIMGTGSNIAVYDGLHITSGKHGLGFILGDEASGTYFGKQLITSFLYDTMPKDLKKAFYEVYHVDRAIVLNHVYQKPHANYYLASFAHFMSHHKTHPFIKDLLYNGFKFYVKSHILTLNEHKTHLCHFIGSIAYHFQDILIKECLNYGVKVGKIMAYPVRDIYNFILAKSIQV